MSKSKKPRKDVYRVHWRVACDRRVACVQTVEQKMKKAKTTLVREPIEWPRADPAELAKFDPHTKECTMNCGPCRDDPRTDAERKFLCDDCVTRSNK